MQTPLEHPSRRGSAGTPGTALISAFFLIASVAASDSDGVSGRTIQAQRQRGRRRVVLYQGVSPWRNELTRTPGSIGSQQYELLRPELLGRSGSTFKENKRVRRNVSLFPPLLALLNLRQCPGILSAVAIARLV